MQIDIDSLLNKIDCQPLDTQTAYLECLFVMLHCAPLRLNELLSITPETAEIWDTMSNGTKRYGWCYLSSYTKTISQKSVVWIPAPLVSLAQKAISRLRELQPKMTLKRLKSLEKNMGLRNSCIKLRKQYADAISRESIYPPVID